MFKKNEPLDKLIQKIFNEEQKTKLKKLFWIYVCNVYVFNGMHDFQLVEPRIKCNFIPITLNNYHRASDFREADGTGQYKERLDRHEIGFFAEHDGKMIGSIWATINKTATPCIAEKYFKIMPNEGHIHNNIVSEEFRGRRIGPFMNNKMLAYLFIEHSLSRVRTDIDVRNIAAFKQLKQIGARIDHKLLCLSMFNRSVLQFVLRKYV